MADGISKARQYCAFNDRSTGKRGWTTIEKRIDNSIKAGLRSKSALTIPSWPMRLYNESTRGTTHWYIDGASFIEVEI